MGTPLGPEKLDRDALAQRLVNRLHDDPHSSMSDDADDPVSTRDEIARADAHVRRDLEGALHSGIPAVGARQCIARPTS
jgi:hypothetical protein